MAGYATEVVDSEEALAEKQAEREVALVRWNLLQNDTAAANQEAQERAQEAATAQEDAATKVRAARDAATQALNYVNATRMADAVAADGASAIAASFAQRIAAFLDRLESMLAPSAQVAES